MKTKSIKLLTILSTVFLLSVNSVFLSANESGKYTNLENLLNEVVEYKPYQDNPYPFFELNAKNIELDMGDTFDIKLLDDSQNEVKDVKWFVITRIPERKIFDHNQSQDNNNLSYVAIDGDGHISTKSAGDAQIVALYKDHIHLANVKVRNDKEKHINNKVVTLRKKADDIVKNINHLSDVEKVLYIHDYLVKNMKYDLNQAFTGGSYEGIVLNRGACLGYSQSFKYLMDLLGIPASVVSGRGGGTKHAWNKVKLDDGWYYLDLTWDDVKDSIRHKYFLVSLEAIRKNHEISTVGENDVLGTKYLNYFFERSGYLADNKDGIKEVVNKQLNRDNKTNQEINVYVPISIQHSTISAIIKNLAGPSSEVSLVGPINGEVSGDYTLYKFNVSGINRSNSKDVNLSEIRFVNSGNEITNKIYVTFDQDLGELNKFNFKLSSGQIKEINNLDNRRYEIVLEDLIADDKEQLNIEINKAGFNITNNVHNLTLNINREAIPTAIFEAKNDKSGVLKNLSHNSIYTVGDGNWHRATSLEEVITPIYGKEVLVVNVGDNVNKLSSKTQFIKVNKPDAPSWVVAVNSSKDSADGKLLNVNTNMEYKLDGGEWNDITANVVENLKSGSYKIRMKASKNNLASEEFALNIKDEPQSVIPPVIKPDKPTKPEGSNINTNVNINRILPKTGDDKTISLYALMILISGSLLLMADYKYRKKVK